jgi:hypothetical protein
MVTWRAWPDQRELLFLEPLTLASMVPNTVTPLPLDEDAAEGPALPAEPVPAQPDASTPIAIANAAAMKDDFNGISWMVGPGPL